ncbi:hypothetical protein OSB04_002154 [Centaurea solstitialis]|uniref:CCHC-type domain-containing protein n=1 Tax=Centaurea solstitialis TaxID=347529 RepID=A0AA38TSC0_9ASTR|nr:hypothetical protein OSB04_002154 [Centaurea solstitialis]
MDDLSTMAPKSTVQISEIVSDDCTNRAGENGRSPGTSEPGNVTLIKPTRKDKGKDKIVAPESEVASSSRTMRVFPRTTTVFKNLRILSNPRDTHRTSIRRTIDGHVRYMDSGCSKHMTGKKELLANFKSKYGGNVRFGNKLSAPIMGYGDILHDKITINKVAYVEGLSHNLLSIGKFCDKGLEVNFRETRCCVRTYEGMELIRGTRKSNLYKVNFKKERSTIEICLLSKASLNQNLLWHRRLSHLNYATINQLVKAGLVTGLPSLKFTKKQLCSACEMGKIKKSSHMLKVEHGTSKPLQLLHMDLCGPMRTQSINGRKYVLVIVDDYSRYTWVNFLRSKDGAPEIIISFIRNVQNRTLVEAARTMLASSKLPLHFWAEAVSSACFTQNRSLIHKRFMKTPYELVYNKPPNIKFLRTFGCECVVKNDKDNLDKFSPKGDEGVFIGYAKDSPTYRIYNKKTRCVVESTNVDFEEGIEEDTTPAPVTPGISGVLASDQLHGNPMTSSSPANKPSSSNSNTCDLDELFEFLYKDLSAPANVALPIHAAVQAALPVIVSTTDGEPSHTFQQQAPVVNAPSPQSGASATMPTTSPQQGIPTPAPQVAGPSTSTNQPASQAAGPSLVSPDTPAAPGPIVRYPISLLIIPHKDRINQDDEPCFDERYAQDVCKVGEVLWAGFPKMAEEDALLSHGFEGDYICRGHILNGMSDSLFDVYQNVESTKELWDRLEAKYMAEDVSSKKFLVGNFLNYKMVDTRPVMEQYHELQRMLGQFAQYDMKMDESISVSSIIDKLPPSWKDFKNNLKHKKEELTLVELGSHFQIEQFIRDMEKVSVGGTKTMTGSSVNMMEEGESSKAGKGKRKFHGSNNKGPNKKPKVTCWKCGKPGHFKKDCRSGKGGGKVKNEAGPSGSKDPGKQSGMFVVPADHSVENYYVSMISESFYVQDDDISWWVDSGATCHVCKNLQWFKDFKPIEDGSLLKMGNVATEPIKGLGSVNLVFTSGNSLLLCNVLYVPRIRKNLVSGIVLNNCGYKQVMESDKCKTKGATYMSMKFSRFKKLGLGFDMLMKDKDIG